ncbi:MAG TPA: hypothetical protein VLA49_21865 [Anaerolineales bacterium]|nr:hypothetical protein [Anaerolineales bacterium]
MIESIIRQLLGPSGIKILDWYVANNLYVNGFIVTIGVLYLLFPKHSKRLTNRFREFWLKTPFALDEKDRQAIERMRARLKGKKLE